MKNGDTESYEKVEKYLMEHKGKTKNQMKKLMQSASRTDPIFKKYIEASKSNDADTTHTLYRQLLNIYGSESKFKSALRKCQDKIKKQKVNKQIEGSGNAVLFVGFNFLSSQKTI